VRPSRRQRRNWRASILERILATEPVFEDLREAENLAALQRLETAMLFDLLRPVVGGKNRNRSAIALAGYAAWTREIRVERRDKQRSRVDELIKAVAMS